MEGFKKHRLSSKKMENKSIIQFTNSKKIGSEYTKSSKRGVQM